MKLKTLLNFALVVFMSFMVGCNGAAVEKDMPVDQVQKDAKADAPQKAEQAEPGKKYHLTVDFKKDEPLYYRFVSTRLIKIDWDPSTTDDLGGSKIKQIAETLDIYMSFTPVEVDPYGVTTIRAECADMLTLREASSAMTPIGKDAVKRFEDQSYTFTVGPTGKILDNSQLYDMVKNIGEKAFRTGSGARIKNQDMIGDYIATQWFLWDSVSSIERPAEGVAVGQSWKSKLSVPTPMVLFQARDVEYTFSEIMDDDKGQIAVIKSTYSPSESYSDTWPIPYEGRFQMAGTFGFLRNYKLRSLTGSGREMFNMDSGKLEFYEHKYTVEFDAKIPMAIGANPRVSIDQKLVAFAVDKLPETPEWAKPKDDKEKGR